MSNIVINPGVNENIDEFYSKIDKESIIERIWRKDYTVWSSNPTEISNRLGWLDSPAEAMNSADEINEFVTEIQNAGFENALLLGMGGSSLAPEVFSTIFGTSKSFLNLYVLDSTHPDQVKKYVDSLNPRKTIYIVSTKSGGTIETISLMKFFYTFVADQIGLEYAGKHFVAITDPGSGLQEYARKYHFRKIFLNNPDIGGRFSALSIFGLVPAALIGVDIKRLLNEAYKIIEESKNRIEINSSARIGALIGAVALNNCNKLTFIIPGKMNPFGVWVEQLIAESTGKIGKGILPVENELLLKPEEYGKDRIFVYLKLKGDNSFASDIQSIEDAGFPLIKIDLDSEYELGAEFFRWEFATAVAGYVLNVQPFDQPDVESAKILAREMMKSYNTTGKLPVLNPQLTDRNLEVITDAKGDSIQNLISKFFSDNLSREGGYVSIHAYAPYEEGISTALQKLRNTIQMKYKTATTIGFGPRFLHSTGQLHKGDNGTGVYIQIFARPENDYPIPEEPLSNESSFSFSVLVNSQSLGDRQALLNNGRKVIRFNLKGNIEEGILKLTDALKA